MRGWIYCFIYLVATLFVPSWALAQPPAIDIELSFDSTYYGYGEPVGVNVLVTNESGSEILIKRDADY